MIRYYADIQDDNTFFAIYDAEDGSAKKMVKWTEELLGIEVEETDGIDAYDNVGTFLKDTLIISPKFINEDFFELVEAREIGIYII
jgi:hypothetical protein